MVTIRIGNFGSNASYTCETGYMLNGDMTRMCQDNGDWSGTAPTCDSTLNYIALYFVISFLYTVAVDCSDLTDPTDGAVNTSSGTTFNMNATYSCNTGYNLNGTNARTCQADRMWSGNEPACDSTLSSLVHWVYTVLIASSSLQLSPVQLSLTLIMEWLMCLTTTLGPLLTTRVTLATC